VVVSDERSVLPWVIFVAVLGSLAGVLLVVTSSPSGNGTRGHIHPLGGKWRSPDFGSVIVYDDRWALVNGVKCSWEPAGPDSVRIELDLKKLSEQWPGIVVSGDFRLRPTGDGRRQAVLSFLAWEHVFERDDDSTEGLQSPP
jgi:hypothetical protein